MFNKKPKDDNKDEEIIPEEMDTVIQGSADDDVVPEEEEGNPQAVIKSLRDKIKVLTKEKQEYLDGWQRSKADYSNLQKRTNDEKRELVKFANENLIEELMPVIDAFEMAFANKEAWEKVDKNWRMGVEYINTKLHQVLSDNGLKEIMPKVGEVFDPAKHIIAEHRKTDKKEDDHKIIEVRKRGFELSGKTVVVPQVVVWDFEEVK